MNWGSTWDFLWHFLIIFAWVAYLLVLFQILTDLFWRDHKTSGVVKAIWVIFLFLIPWLTALVYLIARGQGMSVRAGRPLPRPSSRPTITFGRPPGVHRPRRSRTPRNCSTRARSPRPNTIR